MEWVYILFGLEIVVVLVIAVILVRKILKMINRKKDHI